MFKLLINGTRVVLILLWIAVALSLAAAFPGGWNALFITLGSTVFIIHLLEYIIVILKTGRRISLFRTLLLGYAYWLPLFKNADY